MFDLGRLKISEDALIVEYEEVESFAGIIATDNQVLSVERQGHPQIQSRNIGPLYRAIIRTKLGRGVSLWQKALGTSGRELS